MRTPLPVLAFTRVPDKTNVWLRREFDEADAGANSLPRIFYEYCDIVGTPFQMYAAMTSHLTTLL
jgi:hypothetical protein